MTDVSGGQDMTWSFWLALMLAVAIGSLLGRELATLRLFVHARVTGWLARRTLRRTLPDLERKAYTSRELDRQQLERDLRAHPEMAPEAVAAQLQMFDALTDTLIRHNMQQARRVAGLEDA